MYGDRLHALESTTLPYVAFVLIDVNYIREFMQTTTVSVRLLMLFLMMREDSVKKEVGDNINAIKDVLREKGL